MNSPVSEELLQEAVRQILSVGSWVGAPPVPVMAESPFAPSRHYLSGSSVNRYLGQHYPALLAPTGSCPRPRSSVFLCLSL
jgi:hypothetical protein